MAMISENDTRAIFKWLVSKQQAVMFSIEYIPQEAGILKAFRTVKARSESEAIEKSGIPKQNVLKIRMI